MNKTSKDVCDFVWQYEHRKKWCNFSDEDIQNLNESVKRDNLKVPVDKQNIKSSFLDMKCMLRVFDVSFYKQRARCVVTDPDFHVWLFEYEKNDWECFPPDLSYFLEVAYQKKETKTKINNFEFNLVSLKGLWKKGSFSIKREKVQVNLTDEIKTIIQKNQLVFEKACSQEYPSIIRLSEPCIHFSSDKERKRKRNLSVDEAKEDSVLPVTSISKVLKTTEKKQLPAVDSECPVKEDYHVYYTEDDSAFSATLSQTSLQNNNNKFYFIQLLRHNTKNQYCVWRRWGRVGLRGQTNLNTYGTNIDDALKEFETKFFDKTKNYWEEKESFVHVKGKYDLLQINLSPQVAVKVLDAPSKLSVELQALMTLICDTKRMEETMMEMSYDSNKMPLGELTLSQVKSGYIALNKIAMIVNRGGTNAELLNACNDFYTKIPHNFGMKTPKIINNKLDIENKQKMLEALTNIKVAMNVMNTDTNLAEHQLDKYYKSLDCSLDIIEPGCSEYMEIEECLKETHGPTHNSYTMEIVRIFKCSKPQTPSDISTNKLLLFHGSRIINWFGILKDGLRIAPPEAPKTGYMFGKGIYFADVCSKSANYCYASKRKNEGLLLMSEVSMGNQYTLYEADEKLPDTLPPEFDSVVGRGKMQPSDYGNNVLSCDAKIPKGPLVHTDIESSLLYNEYIVYNVKQVRMKYLIWLKFNIK